jgi:DNA-binding CsgD family transcriptional regulator
MTQSGASPTLTVDVIDDVLFVGPALDAIAQGGRARIAAVRASTSWLAYIASDQGEPRVAERVVVRAELRDHVPIVLKIRALTRLGVHSIVLTDDDSPAFERRLLEAGAAHVLTKRDDLETLLAAVVVEHQHASAPRSAVLSDRELQVACLYAGRTAATTSMLAEILGVPLGSVRTHLRRARGKLSPGGPVSTREQLRARLIEEGWLNRAL